MASILRSSKFVRYIAGFARNVVLNPPREFDGNVVNSSYCLCGGVNRSLASQVQQHDENLDHALRRLDQDVRKIGRISRRDIEDILDEIKNTRSATSSQSLLVIRCCGNLVPEELPERRTSLVQEIWSTLNKLKVPMDISHYNALLRVYLENEHVFSPTEFLAEVEAKGLEPNRVTYQRLIARYCKMADIEGATKILQFMRDKQMPVNENVFNALVIGHFHAGDESSAKGILSVMRQAGLEPTADTYTTLLCGYAKNGNINAINTTLEDCEKNDVYLLDKDFLEIVHSLAVSGHYDHIPTVLSKIKRSFGYNQEAVNLILRLITKGEEDAAFVVLQTIVRSTDSEGVEVPVGNFFIKQLVRANRPVEKIIELCKKLESTGMYPRAISLATETSLEVTNDALVYPLFEELKKTGIPIRQHYFWPLLMAKTDDKPEDRIIKVLLQMQKFGLSPNGETIRDYVIPNLKGRSSDILSFLRAANVTLATAGSCLTHYLLTKQDLKEAAVISSQVAAYYNPETLRRLLTVAFYKTKDLDSYIKVIRNIYENLDRFKRNEENDEENSTDKTQVVGNLLFDLTNKWEVESVIEDVLNGLIKEGLSISTTTAEKIQDKLGEKMTDSISSLLQRLTSGELTPTPFARKPPSYVPSAQMNAEQLERLVHNLQAKNQDTKGLKRQLLGIYHRDKNLLKTEKLLEDLEKDGFVYTQGAYAQLVDLYTHHENIEKALFYYNKLKESAENFKMDVSKTVALAHLLVKSGKFQEGIDILKETPYDSQKEDRGFNYSTQVWRFLNYLAEEGRVEDLNTLFNILVENKFIEVNNVLLGPLIKVHLVKNDLETAVEKFEWCVNQFRATPWKNELTCKLIQNEDGDKLQKLTDLSTAIHGEINSLYDLVFAFVECGRIRQARKILETPGLQVRPQRISFRCERYRQEGNIKPLEDLRDATKDLDHINRGDIYYQLLLSYIKQDESDKAVGLWTQMQEEDIAPSEQFLLDLGTFLQSKRLDVPFAIPSVTSSINTKKTPKTTQSVEQSLDLSNIQIFRRKLKAGDVVGAFNHYKSSDNHSISDASLLIEKLVQVSKLEDASTVTLDLLNRGAVPLLRVFKFYLNKLVASGDIETLEIIGSKVSRDVKKNVSFDNRVCHANLIAGRGEQYLKLLENEIDEASEEDCKGIEEKFPRGGSYGILEKHGELIDKFENLAVKYSNRGIIAPFNVLWTHYFITGDDAKAAEIWNKYLKNAPRIMFQRIVHAAREKNDEELITKLINHLKTSNVTEGAMGNAYSCLLDVIVTKNNPEEAMNTFETIVKEVGLHYINRTAILRVKEHYNNLGKPFNYEIPPKNVKTTSTSLEDDDRTR